MYKSTTILAFALLLGSSLSFAQKTRLEAPQASEKTKPTFDPTKFYPKLDSEPPVLTCLNGLSANLMPGGILSLWATDFLLNVTDNETPLPQIQLGIRKAGLGTGFPLDGNGAPQLKIIFDCNEQGSQEIELWAMDLAGNVASCASSFLLQDNAQNCNGGPGPINFCTEKYCDHAPIAESSFTAYGSAPFAPPLTFIMTSNTNGCLVYQGVPIANSYEFFASKDDNPLSGISAQDLQLLIDHINGTLPFTEPWQWVAADVNNDLIIDGQDSVELRNLMLGIYQELPNNSSWRFVRSDYVFPNPNPLSQPFPESFTVGELQANPSLKFYGIKIGKLQCNEPKPAPERSTTTSFEGPIPIFPNPSKGAAVLSFELKRPETVHLQIRDIAGKLMLDRRLQMPAGPQSIDIPEEITPVPGVYFWHVQIGDQVESGKFIRA